MVTWLVGISVIVLASDMHVNHIAHQLSHK